MKRRAKGPGLRGAVVLALVAAVLAIVPLPAPAVERLYSRGLYARLQPLITFASGVTSIAILDIVALVLLIALVAVFARAVRQGGWKRGARTVGVLALKLTAIGYLLFLVVWGLNYRRMGMEDKLGFDGGKVTVQSA